jgi:hypothetical protein
MNKCAIALMTIGLMLATSSCRPAGSSQIQSPNGHVRITLPAGWEQADLNPGNNKVSGKCTRNNGYVLVIAEARADFANMKAVDDYATASLNLEEKHAKLSGRALSGPKELKIHGFPALQYEVTGTMNNVNLAYVKTFVALPTQFTQVMCWTTPSHLEECRGDFDAITQSIEEPATVGSGQ